MCKIVANLKPKSFNSHDCIEEENCFLLVQSLKLNIKIPLNHTENFYSYELKIIILFYHYSVFVCVYFALHNLKEKFFLAEQNLHLYKLKIFNKILKNVYETLTKS